MEFDEDKAVEYMLANATLSKKYEDDDVLDIIDMIWDFYESQGLLKITFDDDEDKPVDVEALTKYVSRMVAKDKHSAIAPEDVAPLVAAELSYEATLEE